MSLWFRTRNEDGTVHYILVPFEPLAAIALVGMCLALLLPLLQMFRLAVVASPVFTAGIITSILLVGAALFVLAKMSVIHAGHFVSFGSHLMSSTMRFSYFTGYVLLIAGTIGVWLFSLVAYGAS